MKTKMAILLSLTLVIMVGCASFKNPHRPEFYEKSTTENVMEGVGSISWVTAPIGGASVNARYLRVYPECRDSNTSQGDLWQCVSDIDAKEGRVKENQRANMDNAMRGGQ